jgi:hypothetical protein
VRPESLVSAFTYPVSQTSAPRRHSPLRTAPAHRHQCNTHIHTQSTSLASALHCTHCHITLLDTRQPTVMGSTNLFCVAQEHTRGLPTDHKIPQDPRRSHGIPRESTELGRRSTASAKCREIRMHSVNREQSMYDGRLCECSCQCTRLHVKLVNENSSECYANRKGSRCDSFYS